MKGSRQGCPKVLVTIHSGVLPIVVAVITPHIKEGIMRTFTKLLGTGIATLGLSAGLVSAAAPAAEATVYTYTYTNRTTSLEHCREMLRQDIIQTNAGATTRVHGYTTCTPSSYKPKLGEPRGYEYTFTYQYW